MRRIPLTLLFILPCLLIGSATYDGLAKKERPGYAAGHIIVKYKTHLDADQVNSAQSRTGSKLHEFDTHTRLVSIAPGRSITQSIDDAMSDPDVEYAEPDYIRHASKVPNDPYYPNQWGLADMSAPDAWNINTGNNSAVIAIIDSGVNSNHPDLAPNITTGWDSINNQSGAMDMCGHGTSVAGVAAGRGDNGLGISGTSWGSKILPLRASDYRGDFTVSNIIMAIDYAISHGAKIISASYSGEGYSQFEYEAISRANSAGIVFVASAGNDNLKDLDSSPVYPAAYDLPNMITVASVDSKGNLSNFSNYGEKKVHVAAPGEDIWTTSHSTREVLSANFDSSADNFTLDGNWVRTRSHFSSSGYSLTNSINSGKYHNNMIAIAASPQIDLTSAAGCRLQFMIYGSSELNRDYLRVETSTDGVNWATRQMYVNLDGTLQSYYNLSGSTLNTWKSVYVDLGTLDGSGSARFRFRFTSDAGNIDEGFFIDDVKITAASDGGYSSYSGTSFSAPYVAGLAGLIRSQYPEYGAVQVRNVILNSATKCSGLNGRVLTGGKINAYKALNSPNPDPLVPPDPVPPDPVPPDENGGGGGCFIATAAFGSALAPEVIELRRFRDKLLAHSEAGRWFIRTYYRYSPPAADFIRDSELLRSAARTALLPLIVAAHLILRPAWLLGIVVLLGTALLTYKRRREENLNKIAGFLYGQMQLWYNSP